jgi:phosphate transport system substrate-binding protein
VVVPFPPALLSLAVVLAATSSSCSMSAADRSRTADIKIDGSSTVFVLSEAVAEEFTNAGHRTRITVGQSGTGGGFQKFCRGETDINNASRPIKAAELAACAANGITFFEIPVAYDGIAIVVHPRAHWVDQMTVDELRTLWAPDAQGKVTRWSQVRRGWPDREIHLFGAGVDSGTFDYFTEAVTGQARASRGDFTSSEDDNVLVQGVAGDELALGFLPFAYYRENQQRLKLIPIVAGHAAKAVAPSLDSIRDGTYQPLSRPLFIYATSQAVTRQPVQQFTDFYIAHAGSLADEVGYVHLGDEGYRLVAEHFARRVPGTLFGEHDRTGLTIEQLLAKERQ